MNTSDFKKTHFLIIAAIILILALLIGGFLSYKRQKELARQETVSACLKSLEGASSEDIARLIGQYGGQEAMILFSKYLGCRFRWITDREVLEKYSRLVNIANFLPETRQNFVNALEDTFVKSSLRWTTEQPYFPIALFLLKDFGPDIFCPRGIMDEDIFIVLKNLMASKGYPLRLVEPAADRICSLLWRYSANPEIFEEEIANFADWPEDAWERKMFYRVNISLIIRFLAPKEPPGFCNSLPLSEEINDCREIWTDLASRKERVILHVNEITEKDTPSFYSCQELLDDTKEKICEKRSGL